MSKLFIVANFKSHLNKNEADSWLSEFLKHKEEISKTSENKEIIVAPSFTLLLSFYSAFSGTNIKLAAQDISSLGEGAYTGEVNGRQIKDFADYVIIGHSERRDNFKESDEMLDKKVKSANNFGLETIFCVQNRETQIPEGVKIIAYEPIFAIGTGTPDTPENAEKVCEEIMNKNSNYSVLYGGSVSSENIASFTKKEAISGVLVGGASLNPQEFIKIINNA